MIFELVVATLESIQAHYAVIGGQAVAMRGHPRLTVDYDKGDPDDPLAGVVHISLEDRDVVVVIP